MATVPSGWRRPTIISRTLEKSPAPMIARIPSSVRSKAPSMRRSCGPACAPGSNEPRLRINSDENLMFFLPRSIRLGPSRHRSGYRRRRRAWAAKVDSSPARKRPGFHPTAAPDGGTREPERPVSYDSEPEEQRFAKGDQDAGEALFRRFSPYLAAIVQRRGLQRDLEEILSDVWRRILQHRARYDSSRPFQAWSATITLRCCNDHLGGE